MTLTVLIPRCTGSLLPGTKVRASPGAAYFIHSEHKEVLWLGWEKFWEDYTLLLFLSCPISILFSLPWNTSPFWQPQKRGNFLQSHKNGWGVSGSPKDAAWAKVHLNTVVASRLPRNCLFFLIFPILPQKECRSWKTCALPAKRCRTSS